MEAAVTDKKLTRLITEFLSDTSDTFTTDRFFEWAAERGSPFVHDNERYRAADLFVAQGCFTNDLRNFERGFGWARGAVFVIAPTDRELRDRVLVPGHRFVPFAKNALKPWDCRLVTPAGNEIQKTTYRIRLSEFEIYGTLLGKERLIAYLLGDRPENEERLAEEKTPFDPELEITVFELGSFFEETGFERTDSIAAVVRDPEAGVFELTRRPAAEAPGAEAKAAFVKLLDEAFTDVFELFGPLVTIPLQIGLALYRAGDRATTDPPLHLGGYLAASKRVALQPYRAGTILWSGSPPGYEDTVDGFGTLDRYLAMLGVSLSESEIEAYMRDECFTHGESLERVKERCFGGRTMKFPDREARGEFDRLIRELWDEVQREYNFFADQETGPLRSKALSILDEQTAFIRSLDARRLTPDRLPQEFYESGQAAAFVTEFLELLNRDSRMGEEESRRLMHQLEQLHAYVSDTISRVTGKLAPNLESRNSRPDSDGPSDGPEPGRPRASNVLEFPGSGGARWAGPGSARRTRSSDAGTGESRSSEANHSGGKLADAGNRRKGRPSTQPIYVFKITLRGSKPPIWRRVRVPGSFSLGALHRVIQVAMGWEDYHLHAFEIDSVRYGDPSTRDDMFDDFGEKEKDESKAKLGKLGLSVGDSFLYEYDFGDGWEHVIKVEQVLAPFEVDEAGRGLPVCLKGKRACPPEDCGGIWGYAEMLEALADPASPEHAEWKEWAGEFDPEEFDPEMTNDLLLDEFGG